MEEDKKAKMRSEATTRGRDKVRHRAGATTVRMLIGQDKPYGDGGRVRRATTQIKKEKGLEGLQSSFLFSFSSNCSLICFGCCFSTRPKRGAITTRFDRLDNQAAERLRLDAARRTVEKHKAAIVFIATRDLRPRRQRRKNLRGGKCAETKKDSSRMRRGLLRLVAWQDSSIWRRRWGAKTDDKGVCLRYCVDGR